MKDYINNINMKHTEANLKKLKVSDIKAICSTLSLSTKGKKQDLIEKILAEQSASSNPLTRKRSRDDDSDTAKEGEEDGGPSKRSKQSSSSSSTSSTSLPSSSSAFSPIAGKVHLGNGPVALQLRTANLVDQLHSLIV